MRDAQDRLAWLMSVGLILLLALLIMIIGVLAILGKEPSRVLENLAFGVLGAFVGYVGVMANSAFGPHR